MKALTGTEQEFTPGADTWVASDSPSTDFSAVFEDNGETAHFYAYDRARAARREMAILDALHIYNVKDIADRERPRVLRIIWSDDGMQSALLINGHAHAVFDFAAQRGYCRTGFPPPSATWSVAGHSWSDEALRAFEQ